MTFLNFTFQEASPLITYSAGGWVEGSSSNDSLSASYSGESFRVSFTPGATASFSFAGTAVSLFGARRPNHGNYTVQVDQQPLFNSDGNDVQSTFNVSLWHASDLAYARHTVTLTNTPSSLGMFLDLDYVSIERQIGQDGDTIFNATVDDVSPFVQFTGPWETSVGVSSAFQGTLHRTKVANSTTVVQFQGCCIELYGQYANAPYSVTLDNQLPIMMQGLDLDLPENFQHPQTLLYLVDGLSETGHTVTLTNLNSNENRPFMFDYAVVSSTHKINSVTSPAPTANSDNGLSYGPPNNSSDSSPPVGAIVGGVIGGLVVLALIVAGILFGRRRLRRRAGSGFPLDLMDEDPEPKPYVLPTHPESEDEPYGRHSSGGRTHPPVSAGAVPSLPSAKFRTQESSVTSDIFSRSDHASSVGLLSPQEQPEASGSSSRERASSVAATCATRSDSPPLPSSPMSRRAKSRFTRMRSAGGNSGRQMVQEEDAGVVLDPDDKPPTVRTLPPAYNPEWHREPS